MLADYRVRQRDYLLQIVRALTSRLNLNEVLGLILRQTTDLLDSHAALIALVEEDGVYVCVKPTASPSHFWSRSRRCRR